MASAPLRILHRTDRFVAIDKPAGFQVHSPEDPRHRVPDHRNCMKLVRNQLGTRVHPIHRLDGATSGVVLFALDPEMAELLNALFRERRVKKSYVALLRGWIDERVEVERDLGGFPSLTRFTRIARLELDSAVGRYPTARSTLARIEPVTGRLHQIRRHAAHISHPVIGDPVHGDGKHNLFFRETLGIRGLLLRAVELRFPDPSHGDGRELTIRAPWTGRWHRVFDLAGACPL